MQLTPVRVLFARGARRRLCGGCDRPVAQRPLQRSAASTASTFTGEIRIGVVPSTTSLSFGSEDSWQLIDGRPGASR